ncbi:MAG: hypothetical protein U0694_22670 [Anaerolineae bacterium]
MRRFFPPFYNFLSFDYWFGEIDSRPLAIFRIFFAALLLKDALFHLPLAYWFYSNDGLFPLPTMHSVARFDRFSLMDAMPYTWMAVAFFVLWALVNLCLLLGYRTRLMAVLNFVIIVSVHERNIYVLSGADTTLRVLSFWAMFLPMGQYYSLDALRKRWSHFARSHVLNDLRVSTAPQTAFAFPLRLVQLQVGLIYVFTFVLKLPGQIWQRGEALFYAFQLRTLTLPTADWLLLNAPDWLLKLGSYAALVIEGAFVPLVFSPVGQPVLRMLGLLLGMMLHLGIAVTMAIQDFSLVMMISYFTLYEARWIVWLDNKLRSKRTPLAIAQPAADSPLWLLLAVTRADEIRVEPLDTESSAPPAYDAWQVKDLTSDALFSGSEAWQQAAGHLPLSRLWRWVLRFHLVRRLIWVASRRLVVRDAPPTPVEQGVELLKTRRPNWIGRVIMFALLSTMLFSVAWWNLGNVEVDELGTPLPIDRIPYDLSRPIWYTGMWQHWGMFSPYPSVVDGWIEIPGYFEDYTMFDLRTGERPALEMPRYYWGPVARWKKFEENMNRDRLQALLSQWGAYYCNLYNTQLGLPFGRRLATLDIIWRYRDSYPPGTGLLPYQEEVLWHHWCYDQYAPTG